MDEQSQIFTASRWTAGNLFFPVRIEVSRARVARIKPRLFGSSEESIAIPQVASVKIDTGMIWADILIESSSGADPLVSSGHRKEDARAIRELIERFQQGTPAAGAA